MHPSVSIIVPVLDEIAHISDTVGDLLAQDYAGPIEFVFADGGSTDGTREWLAGLAIRDDRVLIVDNPERRQAHGLNLAAAVAGGEVLVRADAHSRYASNYVSVSVSSLSEVGGAVGGKMNPVGYDRLSDAVAAAMNSRLTMGPGRFHHAVSQESVDTVYLGAMLRDDFLDMGGFRSFPSGSSEDADFYFRWRASGRSVHVDPSIVSSYAPRSSLSDLWRQYWRYGQGKAEMLWVNGRFPSWRPLAPLFLVLAMMGCLLLGIAAGLWLPLALVVGSWVVVLAVVALPAPAAAHHVVVAAGVMHLAYGLGCLWGLFRGPFSLRHLR